MDNRYNNQTEFCKRAIDLLCHKFISDYRVAMHYSQGEEIEHFFEVWTPQNIRELTLREMVWSRVMMTLRNSRGG